MVSSLLSLRVNHSDSGGSVDMVTMVSAGDGLSRKAVTVVVLGRVPPCSSMARGDTTSVTTGLSDIVKVAVVGTPSLTRAGRLPKDSSTPSPSSSSLSSTAVNTKLCRVSVGPNSTLAGTPL